MSFVRFVLRRAAAAVVSFYAVVSVTFVLINGPVLLKLQEQLAISRYCQIRRCDAPPPEDVRQSFVAARNLDVPVSERYVRWLVDVTTLDWGYSFAYGRPVIAVIDGRVQTTLGYVLPGVAAAIVLGVTVGLLAALARDGVFDWSVRLVAYVLLGVPSFMVIIYLGVLSDARGWPGTALSNRDVVATLTVAAGLLAGQVRFARVSALEQSGRAFVKMLRAKGASRLRLARHVLRNAALPILSLSMSELLSVLALTIYVVEDVLGIEGLAAASLRAVREADMPLVIWTTLVVAVLGILGNFLQETLYGYLDPRVRTD